MFDSKASQKALERAAIYTFSPVRLSTTLVMDIALGLIIVLIYPFSGKVLLKQLVIGTDYWGKIIRVPKHDFGALTHCHNIFFSIKHYSFIGNEGLSARQ